MVVWHTIDGGTSWQPSLPLDISFLTQFYMPDALQFISSQYGWFLVHVGRGTFHDYIALFHSTDSGATWSRIQDPWNDPSGIMSCSKTGMLFTDANHGWLTGDCEGVMAGVLLYKSIDAGYTWQTVTLPAPLSAPSLFDEGAQEACGSYDPFFFGNNLGHMNVQCFNYSISPVTYSYYIYTTKDGGGTWSSAEYSGKSLYFYSPDTGWALASTIQRTSDGGVTWTPVSTVSWTPEMDFISEQIGWVVATAGDQIALVKTITGGEHWIKLSPVVGP